MSTQLFDFLKQRNRLYFGYNIQIVLYCVVKVEVWGAQGSTNKTEVNLPTFITAPHHQPTSHCSSVTNKDVDGTLRNFTIAQKVSQFHAYYV